MNKSNGAVMITNEFPSEAPIPGNLLKQGTMFPPNTVVKYYTANLSDNNNKLILEQILTKSLECQGVLREPKDIVVLTETGAFDKDGCYNVMIKYLEVLEK